VVESNAYKLASKSTPMGSPAVQRPGNGNQDLREVCEDAPVMGLIGVGQRCARYLARNPIW